MGVCVHFSVYFHGNNIKNKEKIILGANMFVTNNIAVELNFRAIISVTNTHTHATKFKVSFLVKVAVYYYNTITNSSW